MEMRLIFRAGCELELRLHGHVNRKISVIITAASIISEDFGLSKIFHGCCTRFLRHRLSIKTKNAKTVKTYMHPLMSTYKLVEQEPEATLNKFLASFPQFSGDMKV